MLLSFNILCYMCFNFLFNILLIFIFFHFLSFSFSIILSKTLLSYFYLLSYSSVTPQSPLPQNVQFGYASEQTQQSYAQYQSQSQVQRTQALSTLSSIYTQQQVQQQEYSAATNLNFQQQQLQQQQYSAATNLNLQQQQLQQQQQQQQFSAATNLNLQQQQMVTSQSSLLSDGVSTTATTAYRTVQENDVDTTGASKSLKPNFVKIPSNKEVTEGKMVRFDLRVSGRPFPDVSWYLNGYQVIDDATHKLLVNEGGVHALMITSTSRTDAGNYTCVARNKSGETTFNVNLHVIGKANSFLNLIFVSVLLLIIIIQKIRKLKFFDT